MLVTDFTEWQPTTSSDYLPTDWRIHIFLYRLEVPREFLTLGLCDIIS